MLITRGRMKRMLATAGTECKASILQELGCSIDAQHLIRSWDGIPSASPGDEAPFALFSYYSPRFHTYNPGDFIQTLAVKNALESIGITDFSGGFIPRDELSLYRGRPVRCVMQGWFSQTRAFWPSPAVRPVFVGTHLTVDAAAFVETLMKYAPQINRSVEIGCRDEYTLEFCRRVGIRSYLSRCLTLTLPKRKSAPASGRVFLVDIPDEYLPFIPASVREGAERFSQRERPGELVSTGYSPEDQMTEGNRILDRYRNEASLVVTTAIHSAMPCLATGIPVVFIEGPAGRDPTRYSALRGIVPVNSFDDLKAGRVDFNPPAADIEHLKGLLLSNLKLSIAAGSGAEIDRKELADIRAGIAGL